MIVQLMARVAELERKLNRMAVPGIVRERDHEKGVRFEIAKDAKGQPVLSSWVQPPDQNKGTRSRWLPQEGSQHLLITIPGTDMVASFVPMSHHQASPNPASGADDTVIYDDGECRIAVKGGTITLKAGSSVVTIKDGKVNLRSDTVNADGENLTHNDINVGDDHEHTEVMPGGSLTGPPAG